MKSKSIVLTFFALIASLTFVAPAVAAIDGLPGGLDHLETTLSTEHEKGLEEFFTRLNEDCDSWDVLNTEYKDVPARTGMPKLLRIESRVLASCLRQEMWYCHSSFTEDGARRYTECETDRPLFDE